MLGRFLNKILGIGCPVYSNKLGGLSMTVQELIDELNKVEDKSKNVIFYPIWSDIKYTQEFPNYVILY